eukprot:11315.XXX_447067_447171_1 [CDS] Oithona nana genome sequencing.
MKIGVVLLDNLDNSLQSLWSPRVFLSRKTAVVCH